MLFIAQIDVTQIALLFDQKLRQFMFTFLYLSHGYINRVIVLKFLGYYIVKKYFVGLKPNMWMMTSGNMLKNHNSRRLFVENINRNH